MMHFQKTINKQKIGSQRNGFTVIQRVVIRLLIMSMKMKNGRIIVRHYCQVHQWVVVTEWDY